MTKKEISTGVKVGGVVLSSLLLLGGISLLREDIGVYYLTQKRLPRKVHEEMSNLYEEFIQLQKQKEAIEKNFQKEIDRLSVTSHRYKERIRRRNEEEKPLFNAKVDKLETKIDAMANTYKNDFFYGHFETSRRFFEFHSFLSDKRSRLSKIFDLDTYSLTEYLLKPREVVLDSGETELQKTQTEREPLLKKSPIKKNFLSSLDRPDAEPIEKQVQIPLLEEPQLRNRSKVKTKGTPGIGYEQPLPPAGGERPLHRVPPSYTILTKKGKDLFDEMKEKQFKNIDYFTVKKFLESEGFEITAYRGSHRKFFKAGFTVIVPANDPIPLGTLRHGILGKNGLQIVEAMA